jgi:CDP-diacylglycerol--serine O-phosphatidyltransferase
MVSTIHYPDFKGKGEKIRLVPVILSGLQAVYILYLSWQALPFVIFFTFAVFGVLNTLFSLWERHSAA